MIDAPNNLHISGCWVRCDGVRKTEIEHSIVWLVCCYVCGLKVCVSGLLQCESTCDALIIVWSDILMYLR